MAATVDSTDLESAVGPLKLFERTGKQASLWVPLVPKGRWIEEVLEIGDQRKGFLTNPHMNLCIQGLKTHGLCLAVSMVVSVKGQQPCQVNIIFF